MKCSKCEYFIEAKEFGIVNWFCEHPKFAKEYKDGRRPLPKQDFAPVFCPKKRKVIK